MEWTQLLKDLTDAVEARNRALLGVRQVDAHISELTAQAIRSGAPGADVAGVLVHMEPLLAQDRPHVCGQDAEVPPAPLPRQTTDREPAPPTQQPLSAGHVQGDAPRYSLREAWEKNLLPWTARTARTYMIQRSPRRGVPVPQGVRSEGAVRYTEAELRSWLTAWRAHAGPTSACHAGAPDDEV
ncbi:hypothetical protein EST92_28500 [Streptomyces sp. TM32]|nr:hypothetical protein EST92_28500 [Streptomyces sp. TM32]